MRKGFGLIAMIFYLLVFVALGAGVVSLITVGGRLSVADYRSSQAFYIADAGKNFALQRIAAYSDWTQNMGLPLSRSFAGGVFTVATTGEAGDRLTLIVTGILTQEGKTYARRITSEVTLQTGQEFPHSFDYMIYCGPPSGGKRLKIEGDARIYGDFFYNGPLEMSHTAAQSGGTIYSTSLTVKDSASFASWEAAPTADMPIWDNSPYEALLAETDHDASASLDLGAGDTLYLNGETKYYLDIHIHSGATVVGPGTLVATGDEGAHHHGGGHHDSHENGDILIEGGAGIGEGIKFIAEHDLTYSGHSELTQPIEVYVQHKVEVKDDLTVPAGSVLYSINSAGDSIKVDGDINASLYAPYGKVKMDGGTIRGLIYAYTFDSANSGEIHGAIISYSPSNIGGTVKLYYDAASFPTTILGLGGAGAVSGEAGLSVSGWREVY